MMMKMTMETRMNKKTNFPDLEKLPNTNFWKHFLNSIWNRPRGILEDIYEKYVLKPKMDNEKEKCNRIAREYELLLKIQLLEVELNLLKTKQKLKK